MHAGNNNLCLLVWPRAFSVHQHPDGMLHSLALRTWGTTIRSGQLCVGIVPSGHSNDDIDDLNKSH